MKGNHFKKLIIIPILYCCTVVQAMNQGGISPPFSAPQQKENLYFTKISYIYKEQKLREGIITTHEGEQVVPTPPLGFKLKDPGKVIRPGYPLSLEVVPIQVQKVVKKKDSAPSSPSQSDLYIPNRSKDTVPKTGAQKG